MKYIINVLVAMNKLAQIQSNSTQVLIIFWLKLKFKKAKCELQVEHDLLTEHSHL